ncbi:unnamed protein product [Ilex paraguariensis]|uniref:J domain-containing protein n=1 Tax=Ilex paraguariensis TaxID=185542 RepID=A0ABC8UDD4_9AQUA
MLISSNIVGPKIFHTSPPCSARFRPSPNRVSAAYATTAERTSSHISSQKSPYEVLGIQMGATCQEIKSAYRRLARIVHPDVASTGLKDTSADEFMKIHTAYATLSDPEKRAVCDRTLFKRQRPVSSTSAMSYSASGFSGYTCRNWETDQCF